LSTVSEITGKSVEAAIAEAEQQFGKGRDQLEIEVLSHGSRGVFGIGGEPARISVRDPSARPLEESPPAVKGPAPEPERRDRAPRRPKPSPVDSPGATDTSAAAIRSRITPSSRSGHETADATVLVREKPSADPEKVAESAREVVETMLTKMGFEAEVSVRSSREPITVDVSGENLGILIGRRGDSLASFQFMVNVILSKQFEFWPRVIVDVQGYRARREESLNSLGQRVAERVHRNRRPFTLEAMPANDRRIIHIALKDRSDVETYSVGEGPARRVVIAPKR